MISIEFFFLSAFVWITLTMYAYMCVVMCIHRQNRLFPASTITFFFETDAQIHLKHNENPSCLLILRCCFWMSIEIWQVTVKFFKWKTDTKKKFMKMLINKHSYRYRLCQGMCFVFVLFIYFFCFHDCDFLEIFSLSWISFLFSNDIYEFLFLIKFNEYNDTSNEYCLKSRIENINWNYRWNIREIHSSHFFYVVLLLITQTTSYIHIRTNTIHTIQYIMYVCWKHSLSFSYSHVYHTQHTIYTSFTFTFTIYKFLYKIALFYVSNVEL